MNPDLQRELMAALERPHRLGTIGGDLEEQLAHCASFSSVLADVGVDPAGRGIDLGTGGGLPGLALAMLWPNMAWTLVDMRVARATEVERSALRLGLGDRTVVNAVEAQQLGHDENHRELYDVAVARAFGPASITAECAAGLVRPGGVLVVSEPPTDAESTEDRWDGASLPHLGFSGPTWSTPDRGGRFAVFRKERGAPAVIPRMPARANRGWYRPSS